MAPELASESQDGAASTLTSRARSSRDNHCSESSAFDGAGTGEMHEKKDA